MQSCDFHGSAEPCLRRRGTLGDPASSILRRNRAKRPPFESRRRGKEFSSPGTENEGARSRARGTAHGPVGQAVRAGAAACRPCESRLRGLSRWAARAGGCTIACGLGGGVLVHAAGLPLLKFLPALCKIHLLPQMSQGDLCPPWNPAGANRLGSGSSSWSVPSDGRLAPEEGALG